MYIHTCFTGYPKALCMYKRLYCSMKIDIYNMWPLFQNQVLCKLSSQCITQFDLKDIEHNHHILPSSLLFWHKIAIFKKFIIKQDFASFFLESFKILQVLWEPRKVDPPTVVKEGRGGGDQHPFYSKLIDRLIGTSQ